MNQKKVEYPQTKKTSIITIIFLFLTTIIFIVAVGVGILISTIYPQLPSMEELHNYKPKLPLQVYSSDGVLLGQFGQEHRIYLNINDTPKMLIKAILAAEDERFYQHGGIDYLGVLRAFIANITAHHIQSGASTITMQVARNFFLSSQKTYTRKFNEALLAYKIEKSLTKNQILELYINQIYLGQRAYGFAEASLTYFGKPLGELSIAQYATLAGLPKAPSAYNPVVNKKRSHERETYILKRMHDLRFITDEQYTNAVNANIYIVKGTTKDATDSGGYVAEMVRVMLYDKYGESIYTQGYKVYTTIDSKMQEDAYSSIRDGILQFTNSKGYSGPEGFVSLDTSNNNQVANDNLDNNQNLSNAFDNTIDYGDVMVAIVIACDQNSITAKIRNGTTIHIAKEGLGIARRYINSSDSNKAIRIGSIIRVRNINGNYVVSQNPSVEGAIVSIDPNDGAIKALIGGFDFSKNNFNHITQANRQPGSSFKPFIYSAGLNSGLEASTIFDDSPVCFPNGNSGETWCPKNDEDNFLGPVSLREALTLSLNVVTAKLINQITPQYALNYVTRFGFSTNQFQPYLTMGLGAFEVTPLQMARAYAVFANGGYLIQPYIIKTITDNNGNILAKTNPITAKSTPPSIDPQNAFVINSILEDVVRYGTGARAYRALHRNDLAGKTGTTSDNKDVWFDGYTPNLVTITWMGYDQPKPLGSHAYGASIALPIWINFMQATLKKMPVTTINIPDGIIVKHNATWKGNDEYLIHNESGVTNEEDNSNNESSAEDNGMNNNNNLSVHGEATNKMTPSVPNNNASDTLNNKAEKPSNIDELIKNIQD
ncbi:MAG: PBP1A family penicillin-binding protein [Bacteroidia bacterium]|nr:MAG: PBP1A family penicillin-binding protein [Bacteroidia bacterium]